MIYLLKREVIALCCVVPFMGCSQNQPPVPPASDSTEKLPIVQIYDGYKDADSAKVAVCQYTEDFQNYPIDGATVYYNDSMGVTFTNKHQKIKPRLCVGARQIPYNRDAYTFIRWGEDSHTYSYMAGWSLTADHKNKTYHFKVTVNIKTRNGVVDMGIKFYSRGLLVPKLNPDYAFFYEYKEELVPWKN